MPRMLTDRSAEHSTPDKAPFGVLGRASRVTKESVERKAEAALGPAMWASDLIWDSIASQGLAYCVLYPLRKRVQALAQKYRHRTRAFWSAFDRLVNRYVSANLKRDPWFRWNWAQFNYFAQKMREHFKEKAQQKSAIEHASKLSLPEDISRRQLIALDEMASKMRRMFRGSFKNKEPRRFLATFASLTAARPGPKPSPLAKRIHRIDQKARAEGHHLTYSVIANKVFPQYQSSSGYDRRRFREIVRLALRNR